MYAAGMQKRKEKKKLIKTASLNLIPYPRVVPIPVETLEARAPVSCAEAPSGGEGPSHVRQKTGHRGTEDGEDVEIASVRSFLHRHGLTTSKFDPTGGEFVPEGPFPNISNSYFRRELFG